MTFGSGRLSGMNTAHSKIFVDGGVGCPPRAHWTPIYVYEETLFKSFRMFIPL